MLWLILILTATYLVAEIVGGMMSGSLALLADAGHMALDVAAVALGLVAAWIAKRPPSPSKTYGYYRAEILAALLNSITLVIVSLWIFYEAWERFSQPPAVKGGLMSLVAAGGLLVNGVGLFLMHGRRQDGLNMRGVWLHLLTDALGSLSAMLAGFFIVKFGWYLADPIISVVIAVLILVGAWRLLVDCVDVLMVSVPKGVDTALIKKDVEALPAVVSIHDLHVWSMSAGVTALSAHVRVKGEGSAVILDQIAEVLRVRHRIEHVTLQLEPPTFEHKGPDFCSPEPNDDGHSH